MKLSKLADTSEAVAATSSPLAKTAALARLLESTEPDEISAIAGRLFADPRQGCLGVGWHVIAALDVSRAAELNLTITHVDQALDELAGRAVVSARVLRLNVEHPGDTEPVCQHAEARTPR